MTPRTALIVAAAVGGLLGSAVRADAHRLDEYLQATLLSVDGGRVRAEIALTPGANVAADIVKAIDTDGDGVIAPAEADAYARRVLDDLSLSIDGRPAALTLDACEMPAIDAMRAGIGTIRLRAVADAPSTSGDHAIVFVNNHWRSRPETSAYLANMLAPRERGLRFSAPRRDRLQRSLAIDYSVAGAGWTQEAAWFAAAASMALAMAAGRRSARANSRGRS